jgi:thioredoxin reductase (NADPH)
MYTTEPCGYCEIAKNILKKYKIEWDELSIYGRPELRDEIERLTGGRRDVPQIFIDGKYIGDDDDLIALVESGELAKMFEIRKKEEKEVDVREVIIIGSGPAGFAAGLYAGRAKLSPLMITGNELGGQLSLTLDIENYPGFPGDKAAELTKVMQEQAEKFGTEIIYDYVTQVDFKTHPFKIKTADKEYLAKAVIICTGASPKKLGVPGETEFGGKGVSYCATCDGFFFQDKRIVVVGGGDAAVEEGMFLTRFATVVHLIHRRDRLRASQILQERIFKNEKVKFIWNSVVEEIIGDAAKGTTGVKLKNVLTGDELIHPTDGVFIFIGHEPNTQIFKGQIEMNEKGYIIVDDHQRTNIPGVFAAGDVHDHIFRQAVTAAGAGAAAAIAAERFVAELENRGYPWEESSDEAMRR